MKQVTFSSNQLCGYFIIFLLLISFTLLWNICADRKNKMEACTEWVDGGYRHDPLGFLFQGQSRFLVCKDNEHLTRYYK